MRRRAGLSRRRFLHWGALLVAGALPLRRPGGLQLAAAALAVSPAARFFPDADTLTDTAARFDAVLLPAYAAAELIRRGGARPLERLPGTPGRAHDPAGAFTRPHRRAAAVVICRGATPASLDDVFRPGALWPAFGRLAFAAALLRRGWLPDETHPGRLARAAHDLSSAQLRFVADPARALAAGQGEIALALVDRAAPPAGARFPADGALELEMEWVIPDASTRPAEAEAWLAALTPAPAVFSPSTWTLSPLPARARAHQAALWAELLKG